MNGQAYAHSGKTRYQLRCIKGRFGKALWEELKASGWRGNYVNAVTGQPISFSIEGGVWVMRYQGHDMDEAVRKVRALVEKNKRFKLQERKG